MSIKVMLVDDSAVIRGLIARTLTENPAIEITATASNGASAIILAKQHKPDVVVLDIEMPEMDGIEALPKILEVSPATKVIMASTLTLRNADISLRALALGASECVAKPTAREPEELKIFYRDLQEKILALGKAKSLVSSTSYVSKTVAQTASVKTTYPSPKTLLSAPVKALAIASSTGGPQALLEVFAGLKGSIKNIPIFLTQHMPATFTTILAQHLSKAGERICTEAKDGEEVLPGRTYVAPGNYHMLITRKQDKVVIRLNQEPPVNFCRPAADPMFTSLSETYGKNLLATVLTGMGQDGLEGAKKVVEKGGNVIAQDEATSIVWGMPKAVATNNLCRAVLPLSEIANYLKQSVGI